MSIGGGVIESGGKCRASANGRNGPSHLPQPR